jgi:Na+/H+ antiporter NhaD/arsenite permease-like protein
MDAMLVSLIVFSVTIALLIANIIDRVATVFFGAIIMILLGILSPPRGFSYIDWNVIGILLGMWIITQYMIESKIPDLIVYKVSGSTSCYRSFVTLMFLAAGFISMFVDNVLVILLFGTIMIRAAYAWRKDPVLPVILIGLSANFMGTALLLGDLPPQLLHSIGGAEFLDFIYMDGRLSSFPLLTISFLVVTLFIWKLIPNECGTRIEQEEPFLNKPLAIVSLTYFFLTILLMSIRPLLGVPLGFITLLTATLLGVTVEAGREAKLFEAPEFSLVLEKLEWRAVAFYIALFVLVGGIDASGFIPLLSRKIAQLSLASHTKGFVLLYWSSAIGSGVVEHDALILALFRAIKEATLISRFNPWPYYWAIAWGGTIGSNATVAGAPALYVALSLLEREGIRVDNKRFLKITLLFTIFSSIITFLVTLSVWGL